MPLREGVSSECDGRGDAGVRCVVGKDLSGGPGFDAAVGAGRVRRGRSRPSGPFCRDRRGQVCDVLPLELIQASAPGLLRVLLCEEQRLVRAGDDVPNVRA